MNYAKEIPKEYRDYFGVDDWEYFLKSDEQNLDYVKYNSLTKNAQGFLHIIRRVNKGEKLPPLLDHTFKEYECLPDWKQHETGKEYYNCNPFVVTSKHGSTTFRYLFPNDEYLSFCKSNISNCGMCLFSRFYHTGGITPKQFIWALKSALRYVNYPFGFLTHNQYTYENYMEGLPIVDEFINPNSDNTVYLMKFKINHNIPLFI